MKDAKIDVHLVCDTGYQATDFAGLDWLKRLSGCDEVNVVMSDNYIDIEFIDSPGLLISYGCYLPATKQEQQHLQQFLANGGRWFNVQGNSVVLGFIGRLSNARSTKLSCSSTGLMPIQDSRFEVTAVMQISEIKFSDLEASLEEGIETDVESAEICQYDTFSDIIFC